MPIEHVKKAAAEADQLIEELRQATTGEQATDETQEEQLAEADQGVAVEPTPIPLDAESDGEWRAQAQLWEQRYRSLNGMIQARDKQIQQLHDLLAGMQQTAMQHAPEQQAAPQAQQTFLTKEDEDSYGSELVDMARRAGRQESMQMVAALEDKIARLEQSLNGVSKVSRMTLHERFERGLDTMTNQGWRTLDTDPSFIAWLENSPTRHRVFAEGVRGQDARVVADFFNEYAQAASVQQQREERPVQAKLRRLERQLAPGKSKAGGAAVSTEEPHAWTRSEIAQLYASKRSYAADEFAKLERDVAAAQREGRVDFNR